MRAAPAQPRADDSEIGLRPTQTLERVTARIVYASHPSRISDAVEVREQKVEVDLAGAGLMTLGHVGDLNVPDAGKQAFEGSGEIALHDLHVEQVVLQEGVAFAGRVQHVDGLLAVAEEEAGHAARIDRLD